jgi:hypothetical protein
MTGVAAPAADLIVHEGRTHMSPILEIPEGLCSSHGFYEGLECPECLQTEETETKDQSPISEPVPVVWIVRVNSRTARKPGGPKAA